jgi:hypothetical protein
MGCDERGEYDRATGETQDPVPSVGGEPDPDVEQCDDGHQH